MTISEHTQSALDELRQELELQCCEVVLKKRNAQQLLDAIETASIAVLSYDGDITASFSEIMTKLRVELERMVADDRPFGL